MNPSTSRKRRSQFAVLALVGLTLGTILMSAPLASAQFRGGGYGRGYGGGGYSWGYGGYSRGYGGYGRGSGFNNFGGYRPGFYNRGYGSGGGYGGGVYNRGFYGGGLNIGIGVPAPIITAPIYGSTYYNGYY